jgi:hypothetical protein
VIRPYLTTALIIGLALTTYGCGEPGHHGTPSDPNEQQGNPEAHPEQSINKKSNKQPDGDKAGKDPHTLTPSRAGTEQ